MKTFVHMYFKNAYTEETVAEITFKSRKHSSFNAMLPFFNKKQDKWIIGNQQAYLNVGDHYCFYYAGADKETGKIRALEAFEQARKTLEAAE
jgi:hypothetical protein